MFLQKVWYPFFVLATLVVPCLTAQQRLSSYIDPLLGADGGGNTFPGVTMPFGMVKVGPDMAPGNGNAGWTPDGLIEGFSQTHVSGTGGGVKYGNILIQPTGGALLPDDHGSPRTMELAEAGKYAVTLSRYRIRVELTAAARASLMQITYPASEQSNLLIDAGHLLSSYANQNEDQRIVSSTVHLLSNTEVSGSTTVTGGWNFQANTYTVYFYAVTDTPAKSVALSRENAEVVRARPGDSANGRLTQAWLTFPTHSGQRVHVKVGISFVSEEVARRNAGAQIEGFDFGKAEERAKLVWDKALSAVEVDTPSLAERQQFYTAIYHTMLMPSDRTGDNPLWQSSEPSYDDFYAIWDTFRSSGPLLTLIAEDRQTAIVRSLVDMYRHEHWLPDARSGNYSGRTQGGSNAEFLITDAYLKHLPGIDWEESYKAEKNDAEVSPVDQVKEGRGDLDDWKKLGYLTIEGVDRPGSKQMEYAADDFEVAELAKGLGHEGDAAVYLERSRHWDRLWNTTAEDSGFYGFIWPRHRDGSWKANFDALANCTWGGDTFYEGNSWTYSTFVPQDEGRIVRMMGGPEIFTRRLNAFLDDPRRYDVGNEPGFLAPYLFIWAGRQDETARQLRRIIAASYHMGRSGLPGNDDSGAMSSWYVFGAMGIFPNAGQEVYLIGSPLLRKTTLHLANGKTFSIIAPNTSEKNIYVITAKLNGQPLRRAWFRHSDIMKGGVLELQMGDHPTHWDTDSAPPSESDPLPAK